MPDETSSPMTAPPMACQSSRELARVQCLVVAERYRTMGTSPEDAVRLAAFFWAWVSAPDVTADTRPKGRPAR